MEDKYSYMAVTSRLRGLRVGGGGMRGAGSNPPQTASPRKSPSAASTFDVHSAYSERVDNIDRQSHHSAWR